LNPVSTRHWQYSLRMALKKILSGGQSVDLGAQGLAYFILPIVKRPQFRLAHRSGWVTIDLGHEVPDHDPSRRCRSVRQDGDHTESGGIVSARAGDPPSPYANWQCLGRQLHFIAQPVIVEGGPRDEPQKHKQPEAESLNQTHGPRRQ